MIFGLTTSTFTFVHVLISLVGIGSGGIVLFGLLTRRRLDRWTALFLANTCIEGTSRFAAELGYHVTLVKDATATFSHDRMRAAHELNGPTFAHSILTTAELVAALPRE